MSEEHSISSIRKEYEKGFLDPELMPDTPFPVFDHWFHEALALVHDDANAMVLSTVNAELRPSSRVVLLKDYSEKGLTFFTNYNSKKGEELAMHPHAALNFFWPVLERQIRIEGTVARMSEEESEKYFQSRPRMSQAGAIASDQSKVIPDRQELEERMNRLMALPENEKLQKPPHWGGFLLVPSYFEFWQGRPGRLHDRIVYELRGENWTRYRLSP